MGTDEEIEHRIAALFREDSRRVLATLVRVLGDFDLAEEAMQEAFASALEVWRAEGIPGNPVAWLIGTGRFKGIDILRRRARLNDLQPELKRRADEIEESNLEFAERDIQDDRLRLIFTCCHPAIDPSVQVPLTLREVCGLSTGEIARAFLVSPSAMAQRIVRGKAKIRLARIPYAIPSREDLPSRLDAVLSVVYLIFNEGYCASEGDRLTRRELSEEAIRLARLLLELMPDAEVMGLLALMLLHESRRAARTTADGDIVLLEDQDRSLWDRDLIAEGHGLVERALASGRFGVYSLQAAISAVHARAASASETDWNRIVALYSALLAIHDSSVVELNRAVAVAMRDGPVAGLTLVDAILERGELMDYHLAHAARGELLRRADRPREAREAFERALALARLDPERRLLRLRIGELEVAIDAGRKES
ncbi:MAG: RNA polymerase sigma factor [Candidatus Sumerlaeia bacterium]|nr:RNA polymerase sigma factor [Candidatus Sumerlaeia bacterium]